jgi:hypothetical protein
MLSPAAVRVALDDRPTEPIIKLCPLGEEAWIHLWPSLARQMVRQGKFAGFLCRLPSCPEWSYRTGFGDGRATK